MVYMISKSIAKAFSIAKSRDWDTIFVAVDIHDTVIVSNKTNISIQADAYAHKELPDAHEEHTLILSWNDEGEGIIKELDTYVAWLEKEWPKGYTSDVLTLWIAGYRAAIRASKAKGRKP